MSPPVIVAVPSVIVVDVIEVKPVIVVCVAPKEIEVAPIVTSLFASEVFAIFVNVLSVLLLIVLFVSVCVATALTSSASAPAGSVSTLVTVASVVVK